MILINEGGERLGLKSVLGGRSDDASRLMDGLID